MSTVSESAGLTTRLNRTQIREYLANAHTVPREQLVLDLQSVGLKIKGQGRGGEFMEFVDKKAQVRVKLHPPDPKTSVDHIHIYDNSKMSLSADLNRVSRRSPDAHIEIQPLRPVINDRRPGW